MQGRQLIRVVLWVAAAGDQADDGAAQRGSAQQPPADQAHVPRGVDAEAAGGARQQDAFVSEQQRQALRDLDSRVGLHDAGLAEQVDGSELRLDQKWTSDGALSQ